MILKIKKINNQWVYFDKIDKLVDNNKHPIINGKVYYPTKDYEVDLDAAYILNLRTDNSGECIVVEIMKYTKNDTSFFCRLIAFQEAYLLNDDGKTIEKMAA